ncbi:MAG TPA: hypothetical protein VD731_01985 [Nitrosopumilaceae archaeon]|nr:hypothetical protein [Nitrosopumilaceae archaeon]
MGPKSRILFAIGIAMIVGVVSSITAAFADEDKNSSNPLSMLFSFFQQLKYGLIPDSYPSISSEVNSAAIIFQLKDEVEELKFRLNSLENPTKIYSAELYPVTDIDCSNRNMVDAFLSGWCPHQTRTIYFIEDIRVQKESVIAVTIDQKYDGEIVEPTVCGVINQDVFNFSFKDEKTGKINLLEDLHGFIVKCDKGPVDSSSVLKYSIINT